MEIILGIDLHGKALHTILRALEGQVGSTDRMGTTSGNTGVLTFAFAFDPHMALSSRRLDLDLRYDQETGERVVEFPKFMLADDNPSLPAASIVSWVSRHLTLSGSAAECCQIHRGV